MMTPCDASVDCLHYECLDCHRLLRPKASYLADHPGTVSGFIKRRLCEAHYLARQKPVYKPEQLDEYHEYTVRGLENFMARIRGKSRVRA